MLNLTMIHVKALLWIYKATNCLNMLKLVRLNLCCAILQDYGHLKRNYKLMKLLTQHGIYSIMLMQTIGKNI